MAKKTGKSRSHIANLIRLLSLDKYVVKLLSDGKIDMGHARALISLTPSSQKIYADKVVSQGLTVREIEKMISDIGESFSKKPGKTKKSMENLQKPKKKQRKNSEKTTENIGKNKKTWEGRAEW